MLFDGKPWSLAPRLEYLPVALFGSVMGLTALSVDWRLAHEIYAAPAWIADAVAVAAVAAFVVLSFAYAVKLVTAPDAVRSELRHPIAGNMFATFWIALLLLPLVLSPVSLWLARVAWAAGAAGMAAFAVYIVGRWLRAPHETIDVAPSWIVPVVGLLDMPLAVPLLQVPGLRYAMDFGLAVGLFFTLPLFTLVLARLVFHPALPPGLQPSLLILVAPFAVGAAAYTATTGRADLFSHCLYALTLFMLAVLLGRLRHLPLCCPFRVGWWAVSFPLASATATALRFAASQRGALPDALALVLLACTSLAIASLCMQTFRGMARGDLRNLPP